MRICVITGLAIALVVGAGCSNTKRKEIEVITARIDLARRKSDLEATYLGLRELNAAQALSKANIDELEKVEKAILILQKVRLAKADHDHEEVVNYATDFLELFPDNTEARQAFKESGLIFAYSKEAIHAIDSCFEKSGSDDLHFIQVMNKRADDGGNVDCETVLSNLNRADEACGKAIALDPQFKPALTIRKAVGDCKATLGFVLGRSTIPLVTALAESYASLFDDVYGSMQLAVKFDRFETPQMVWSKSGNKVNKIKDAAKPMFEELTRISRTLGELKCPELGEYPNAVKELSLRVEQFADAVTNPSGGMLDWHSNTLAKSSAFKESAARFLQSCPAANFLRSHFDGFNSLVSKVKLFRNPERTKRAIEKNQALIKA